MKSPLNTRGILYVIAVPIGNLEDITLRAKRLLASVDLILCEDTRTTGKLLELLGLPKRPLLSLHEHNEAGRTRSVCLRLDGGENLALVSDAGTPAISDPGERLIQVLSEQDYDIVPIPGPSAFVAALCASGLSTRSFLFLGFPPTKKGAVEKLLERHRDLPHLLVFYVGPHHLQKFLLVAQSVLGASRRAVVARELTKKFEEFIRGTLGDLVEATSVVRGEVVLLIEGQSEQAPPSEEDLEMHLRNLLEQGHKPSAAAKGAAKLLGCSRDEAYQALLKLKGASH